MRTIETGRLILEPLGARHAPEMFSVLSDPAIYEFENEPPPDQAWLARRFERLESRRSPDGREAWLNWVLRLAASGHLIGYVQATLRPGSDALIAYELNSAFWGHGFAREAVGRMIQELGATYGVNAVSAVFKRDNFRSSRLLLRLGFSPVPEPGSDHGLGKDEVIMAARLDAGAAKRNAN